MPPQPVLYSAGECPVCLDSGAVIALCGSHGLIFFCPLCEVAWDRPPVPRQLDSMLTLGDLSATRPRLPTDEEIRESVFVRQLAPVPLDAWGRFLADHVSIER